MELCLIWAQDRAGSVLHCHTAPWRLPEDMQHFRATTMHCAVIMGQQTWLAIGAKPLQGRQNIVLLRENDPFDVPGAVRSGSIGDAILMAGAGKPARVFIIGGPDLHARTLPVAQRIYVTEVDVELAEPGVEAPAIPAQQWLPFAETGFKLSRTGLRYRFLEYRRAGHRH